MTVTCYEHIDYEGRSWSYTTDTPFVEDANDQFSSVRIPSGTRLTLYEHIDYGGQSITLKADVPDLRAYNWNDRASSLKVELVNDGGGTQPTPIGGFLRPQGTDFLAEDGKPWLFAGYTAHTLIVEIAAGRDIEPLLDEAIDYGANTIVTIGCHLSQWKKDNGFYYDPRQAGYQGHLAALFDACAAKGLRVAYAVLADAQGLSADAQRGIWHAAQDVARGRWNVLLRIGNEGPENGWRPEDFSRADLGGVLQSKGSAGGDTVPYLPPWDWAEYESRRDMPKALLDANCLELAYGGWDANPHGIKGVLVNIEPAFFHDVTPDMYGDARWTDPIQAYRLGLQIGSGCAGGAFGASDGLVCRPLQPRAAECARRFFVGLKAGFMR